MHDQIRKMCSKSQLLVYYFFVWTATSLIGAEENEFLSLNIEDWDLTSFFDYGTLPLTTAVKNILNLNMSFTFIPKYTVLKTDLSKEESVYIMVENATDAAFYFFPSKYPNSAHYKMVPTELQIQGCENHNKCEEVMECERAVVDISDTNLDENVIFISWKQFETETLVILMQYKNKFIKCRHHKLHFQIQKLVMYSSQVQSFGIIDGFFRSTTQENNHLKLNRTFNLQVNQSVSLNTFQCLQCNTSITLTCDNLQKIVNVSSAQGSKLIFSDSLLVNGWKEFSLSNCDTQEFSNCNLTIQTLLQSPNGHVNHIWIIAQGAVTVQLKNNTHKIDEGGESTCLKLEHQKATVEDFERTPTPIITSTSGAKFELNPNNTQSNQTLANCISKIEDILCTANTWSRREPWLIAIFTFTLATLIITIINCYKQWKMDNGKLENATVGYKNLQIGT
jgi:hypothetical protein